MSTEYSVAFILIIGYVYGITCDTNCEICFIESDCVNSRSPPNGCKWFREGCVDNTANPTNMPTNMPIKTNEPTSLPTRSPIQFDCSAGYNMDLIFLVDTSCIPDAECNAYTEGIAELMSSIKGEYTAPRIGIIAFDGYSADVIVPLNSTYYNDILSRSRYIGLTGKIALYNEIRSITCPGNNGDNSYKLTSVLSAIQAAFDIFTYEETQLRNTIYSDRDKKIALFSTCLNTEGSGFENAVCNAYQSELQRTIYDTEVEFTVFNALTSISNLAYNTYFCLTESDGGRQYFAGGRRGAPLTLGDMTRRLDDFNTEICSEPTSAPTVSPTQMCQDNSECPQGMRCCPGRHICEPEGMVPNAKMAFNNVINEPINDVMKESYHSYYEYIILIGVILFVLINNVFIGYWCLITKNKNSLKYEKCDMVNT